MSAHHTMPASAVCARYLVSRRFLDNLRRAGGGPSCAWLPRARHTESHYHYDPREVAEYFGRSADEAAREIRARSDRYDARTAGIRPCVVPRAADLARLESCACLRGLRADDARRHAPHPLTRGDCPAERPCPYAGCRYHLALDVSRGGGLRVLHPDREIWELRETCALDVADRDGLTLESVADLLGLTRERVRQIEEAALAKLRAAGLTPDDYLPTPEPLPPGHRAPRGYREEERPLESGYVKGWGTTTGRPAGRPRTY